MHFLALTIGEEQICIFNVLKTSVNKSSPRIDFLVLVGSEEQISVFDVLTTSVNKSFTTFANCVATAGTGLFVS